MALPSEWSHTVPQVIAAADQTRLVTTLQRDWDLEVQSERFRDICAGKERGHRIADYSEEQTVGFIKQDAFPIAFEHGPTGLPRARSMGDIWLQSGSPRIYNPINVKAGIAGVGGQPNMVSLEKLTQAILDHIIDSYWLLLLHFTINDDAGGPKRVSSRAAGNGEAAAAWASVRGHSLSATANARRVGGSADEAACHGCRQAA
jgi:hypothetical protein